MQNYYSVVDANDPSCTLISCTMNVDDGNRYAYLATNESLAQERGEHQEAFTDWKIVEVPEGDVKDWLIRRRDNQDATHIGIDDGGSSWRIQEIDFYIRSLDIPWNRETI